MHSEDQRRAGIGQSIGNVRIFLRGNVGRVTSALQAIDGEIELGADGFPAPDPEGLHEKIRVAIHLPSLAFMFVASILAPSRSNLPRRRREPVDQEIDESRHLWRQMPAMRVDGM